MRTAIRRQAATAIVLANSALAGCSPRYNPYTAPLPSATNASCMLPAHSGRAMIPAPKSVQALIIKPNLTDAPGLLKETSTMPGPKPAAAKVEQRSDTAYDTTSGCLFVVEPAANAIAAVDPATRHIVSQYQVALANRPRQIVADNPHQQLIIANDGNSSLEIIDLRTMQVTAVMAIGADIGALLFDQQWRRLFVATHTDEVRAYQVGRGHVVPIGMLKLARTRTLGLDTTSHQVLVGTEGDGGRIVLHTLEAAPPKPPRCVFHHSAPGSPCWEGL